MKPNSFCVLFWIWISGIKNREIVASTTTNTYPNSMKIIDKEELCRHTLARAHTSWHTNFNDNLQQQQNWANVCLFSISVCCVRCADDTCPARTPVRMISLAAACATVQKPEISEKGMSIFSVTRAHLKISSFGCRKDAIFTIYYSLVELVHWHAMPLPCR